MYKFLILAAALAVANAGYPVAPVAYAAPAYHAPAYAAVGSSQQSTIRSLDGNSVVSQYSKAVDTAYSSVRKYDTRVSNDGVAIAPAVAYHAPAPVAYAAPAYHAPAAVAAPVAYAAPAYHAPAAYAAPAYAKVAAAPSLLGVAYSAAPAVAHLSFDGYGVHYGY